MATANQVSGRKTGPQYCTACERDGNSLLAHGFCKDCEEYLCQPCFKYHQRTTALKKHILLDKKSMPDAFVLNSSNQFDFIEKCPKHTTEALRLYCQNHEEVLCIICADPDHKFCEVDNISDLSARSLGDIRHQDVYMRLDGLIENCTKSCSIMNHSLSEVQNIHAATTKAIDDFSTSVKKHVDNWAKTLKSQVEGLKNENLEKIRSIFEYCERLKKDLMALKSSIDQLHSSSQTDRLFIKIVQAKGQLDQYERAAASHQNETLMPSVQFVPNATLQTLLKNDHDSSLGLVTQLEANQSTLSPLKDDDRISIKTHDDFNTCLITGMATFGHDQLVLADKNNNCVKAVDLTTNSVITTHKLSSRPWDLTVLQNKDIAVTLPDEKSIQFLSLSKTSELKTLHVKAECYGITNVKGHLIVTFTNPGKCAIISMHGTVISESTPDSGLSNFPYYVEVTKDEERILVSDYVSGAVVILDSQTKRDSKNNRLKDKDLDWTSGLATRPDSSFYVCSKKTHMVLLIQPGGKKTKCVLKEKNGLRATQAICFGERENKLYVSCATGKDRHDNFIKVFKMK